MPYFRSRAAAGLGLPTPWPPTTAYDRLCRSLADELGIDPGEALQALPGGILRADQGWMVRDWGSWPDWLRQF